MPDPLNFHHERSRLTPQQLTAWQGLPLCWVDAAIETSSRGLRSTHPVLALIDAGTAEADIRFPLRSVQLDVAEGTMGLFAPDESRASHWRCRSVRRVMVDIDLPWLVSRGLADCTWRDLPLRQDLAFRDPALVRWLRAMVHEAARDSPFGPAYAESLSVGLISRLLATHGQGRVGTRERGRLTTAQLQRVDACIDCGLAGPIRLAQLADAAGLSAPHFSRLFRSTAGLSPHQHVLRKRVERAQALLQGTRQPLSEVAAATGFASQSHMTAVFVRLLGTTPGRLRD